jgi:hypothetical protein
MAFGVQADAVEADGFTVARRARHGRRAARLRAAAIETGWTRSSAACAPA